MDICPKLRTFKLFVTASLPDLGLTLSTLGHCLDQVVVNRLLGVINIITISTIAIIASQVTLVYPPQHTSLTGFTEFLVACGRYIVNIFTSTIIIILVKYLRFN